MSSGATDACRTRSTPGHHGEALGEGERSRLAMKMPERRAEPPAPLFVKGRRVRLRSYGAILVVDTGWSVRPPAEP